MKVRFLKLAEQELTDAVTWYNQQADSWGEIFLTTWIEGLEEWLPFPCPVPK